jgi:hypothetical protein
MIESVLLDTSFLISLANPKFGNHKNAKAYMKTFIHRDIEMYLSSIVLSEFTAGQPLEDIPTDFLDCLNYIPFTIIDGNFAGRFVMKKGNLDGSDRSRVKDDFKIMAQLKNNSIDAFITGDERDAKKIFSFCKEHFYFQSKYVSLNQPPSVGLVEGNDLFNSI